MIKLRNVGVVLLSLVVLLPAGWAFLSLNPGIKLWISEQNKWLTIYSHDGKTLPGVAMDDYVQILVSQLVDGHEVSRDLRLVSVQCRGCVTNWLTGNHVQAMPSFADLVPDFRISLMAKIEPTNNCLQSIAIQKGFAITYDYGTNQYLRLITCVDRRLINALELELEQNGEDGRVRR